MGAFYFGAKDQICPHPPIHMKPSPPIVTVSMKVINVNVPNEWYPNHLLKEEEERLLSLLAMLRLLEKVAVCKPGREPSPETTLCWNLDHGLPSLQGFEKIHFCRLSPESTALCYGSRGDRHIA